MDTLTRKMGHQRKLSKLQQDIIRQVAKGNKDSKSSLTNVLKKDYPNINDSVDNLIRNGFLQIIENVQKRGKPEKILGLTDKGIIKLIELGISSEDFWTMLFFVYDTTTNHKLELSIDKVFSEYERRILNASSENIPYLTSAMSDGLIVYNFPQITIGSPEDKILNLLIYDGPLTLEQIFQKLNITKNEHAKYLAALGDINDKNSSGMISNALIYASKSKKPIYRATLFAILNELGDLWSSKNSKNKNKEIENKMKSIIELHQNLLPLVFGKWRKLKRFWKEEKLFSAFISWFSKTSGLNGPILSGGLQELFEIQYCWGFSVGIKYMVESSNGEAAHDEWLRKRDMMEEKKGPFPDIPIWVPKENADNKPVSRVIEKSTQLYYLQPYEENVDQHGLDEESTSEKALANTMSFRFYTELLSHEWDNGKDVNLIPIFEKDKDLKSWYFGWFHEFNRYLKEILGKTERIEVALRT